MLSGRSSRARVSTELEALALCAVLATASERRGGPLMRPPFGPSVVPYRAVLSCVTPPLIGPLSVLYGAFCLSGQTLVSFR